MIVPDQTVCGLAANDVIHTPRLVLRPCRLDDVPALHQIFADWEVVRWLSAPSWPQAIEETHAFLEQVIAGRTETPERYLIIEQDAHLAGGLSVRDRPPSHLQKEAGPNVGYWLGRSFWGNGLMTEALSAVVARIFACSAAWAIYSGAFVGNVASLRVQRKLGFVDDGETLLHSRPRGHQYPHANTVLTRARFAQL